MGFDLSKSSSLFSILTISLFDLASFFRSFKMHFNFLTVFLLALGERISSSNSHFLIVELLTEIFSYFKRSSEK